MFEQTDKNDPKKASPILRKVLHSATIAALLLPNLTTVGVALAEEGQDPSDEMKTTEVAPTQVAGINQENLVYENGRLSLINQEPGENIAVVLPNGTLLFKTVPFHGTWQPTQNLDRYKMYPGDELEFFTYSGTDRGDSVFLTVDGEGETRPADQQDIKYGWQQFSFVPTANSTYIGYKTEPFFDVEMTFPNGHVERQTGNTLGQTRFQFPDDYTAKPGETFSVRVFDRNGEELDLTNLDLFRPLSVPNQTEVTVYGDPIPEPDAYSVTIDPNGGTINEDYRITEIEAGEQYTLPYAYKLELANRGHDLAGYSVEGTLLDKDGNEVTEITRFTADYTPVTDVTLTANWERTTGEFQVIVFDEEAIEGKYDVTFTAEDGTTQDLNFDYVREGHSLSWDNGAMPYGTYTLEIDGFRITDANLRGFDLEDADIQISEDGSSLTLHLGYPVNYSAAFAILDVHGEPIAEPNTVTIDPNGGEINEEYRVTEVEAGENYTLPQTFQSDIARTGYTLTGYSVDGTLLDANGEEVSEISRYTADYTPITDVTLSANWEVTTGEFVIQDSIPNFITADRTFALTDGENTYDLVSGSYNNSYRTWRAENIPNGTYTLLVDGVPHSDEWTFAKVGHPDTVSNISTKDGATSVELAFKDDNASTFIRYRLGVNEYPVGVEVRDLNNQRTADVEISVADEDGVVFEGSYDEYNLWTTADTLLPGTYTITLVTPEGTYVEINDTVASQTAVATDEENVFTLDVSTANKGNLSRVFGAFRLVEIEEPAPETDADRYEPVFVDEITLDLNRGNGKLKNPKTLLENMNEMPGGIKVDYTNVDQLDLSGKTTETQTVEITVTYRDGSKDVAEVPLTVIPKDKPSNPGKPNIQDIVKGVVRVVRTIATIIGSLFGGWF